MHFPPSHENLVLLKVLKARWGAHTHIYLFTVVFIAPLLGTFSSYPAKYCWNYFPCSSHLQVCFIIYSSGFGYKSHVHKFQQMSPENEAHSQTVGKPVPQWAVLDFQLSSAAEQQQQHSVGLHSKRLSENASPLKLYIKRIQILEMKWKWNPRTSF